MFCDKNFGPCLQLDRLNPNEKENVVSELISNDASWDNIVNEAAKCIVVCGNCHVKLHHGKIKYNRV